MTVALCINCAAKKFGAFAPCKKCGFTPQTKSELAKSFFATDHFLPEPLMRCMESEGAPLPDLEPEVEAKIIKQLRQSCFIKMTGRKIPESEPSSTSPSFSLRSASLAVFRHIIAFIMAFCAAWVLGVAVEAATYAVMIATHALSEIKTWGLYDLFGDALIRAWPILFASATVLLTLAWKLANRMPLLTTLPFGMLGSAAVFAGLGMHTPLDICVGVILFLFGYTLFPIPWEADRYSLETNTKWAWLRAIEWVGWPLFISQPFVPVAIALYPWYWIVCTLGSMTFVWRILIAPKVISIPIASFGPRFVLMRFVSGPPIAYELWKGGHSGTALLTIGWMLGGPSLTNVVLGVVHAITGTISSMAVGPTQERLLAAMNIAHVDHQKPS